MNIEYDHVLYRVVPFVSQLSQSNRTKCKFTVH